MTNFIVTAAEYANMIRARFPSETATDHARRVGHDLGGCEACDFDFLLEVLHILRGEA
jgi:hypothetical protein